MEAYVSSIPHGGPGSGCCKFCDPDKRMRAHRSRITVSVDTRRTLAGRGRRSVTREVLRADCSICKWAEKAHTDAELEARIERHLRESSI